MKKVIALKLIGGLSETSKMPGKSFGLPTAHCITGSALAKIPGTVCNDCYATKGFYRRFASTVVPAQMRRLVAANDEPQWIEAMVIALKKERWFRWFDSGDLQSVKMLEDIFEVCRQTPWCKHWLATRERTFVRQTLINSDVPENLVIRISATFPDVPVREMYLEGVNYANVHKDAPPDGHECAAPSQNGQCDTCRACWSRDVKTVSYHIH